MELSQLFPVIPNRYIIIAKTTKKNLQWLICVVTEKFNDRNLPLMSKALINGATSSRYSSPLTRAALRTASGIVVSVAWARIFLLTKYLILTRDHLMNTPTISPELAEILDLEDSSCINTVPLCSDRL